MSLRAQNSLTSKNASLEHSLGEMSLGDVEGETEINQSEEAQTPSPPLSPSASDILEPDSALVSQSTETAWREVTVTGGE